MYYSCTYPFQFNQNQAGLNSQMNQGYLYNNQASPNSFNQQNYANTNSSSMANSNVYPNNYANSTMNNPNSLMTKSQNMQGIQNQFSSTGFQNTNFNYDKINSPSQNQFGGNYFTNSEDPKNKPNEPQFMRSNTIQNNNNSYNMENENKFEKSKRIDYVELNEKGKNYFDSENEENNITEFKYILSRSQNENSFFSEILNWIDRKETNEINNKQIPSASIDFWNKIKISINTKDSTQMKNEENEKNYQQKDIKSSENNSLKETYQNNYVEQTSQIELVSSFRNTINEIQYPVIILNGNQKIDTKLISYCREIYYDNDFSISLMSSVLFQYFENSFDINYNEFKFDISKSKESLMKIYKKLQFENRIVKLFEELFSRIEIKLKENKLDSVHEIFWEKSPQIKVI